VEAIRTIEDLVWAQENDPELVQKCKEAASVIGDLLKWLRYLSDAEVPTTVLTKLNRYKKRAPGIHPSSACKKNGLCLLKLYYECTHEIQPSRGYDQEMQQTWDTGTLLHDTIQTHFKNMYEDMFEKEIPLHNEEFHIRSHTDGIFDFGIVRAIFEGKSIKEGGSFGWERVQGKPFEDTIRQAHFYMWLADIPFASIIYMNKNRGLFKEHVIVFDPALWEEMLTNVVEPVVAAAYNDGPMVEATPGWHCKERCDFHHKCPEARRHKKDVEKTRQFRGPRGFRTRV
jgi:hypothetical protein